MSDRYDYGFNDAIGMYCVVDTLKDTAIKFFDREDDAKKFSESKNKLDKGVNRMSELKGRISTEFYNTEKAKKLHPPRAENVGELIKQLERLPKELPLSGWPEKQTHEVVVYNISEHNPHVTIEEVDI